MGIRWVSAERLKSASMVWMASATQRRCEAGIPAVQGAVMDSKANLLVQPRSGRLHGSNPCRGQAGGHYRPKRLKGRCAAVEWQRQDSNCERLDSNVGLLGREVLLYLLFTPVEARRAGGANTRRAARTMRDVSGRHKDVPSGNAPTDCESAARSADDRPTGWPSLLT